MQQLERVCHHPCGTARKELRLTGKSKGFLRLVQNINAIAVNWAYDRNYEATTARMPHADGIGEPPRFNWTPVAVIRTTLYYRAGACDGQRSSTLKNLRSFVDRYGVIYVCDHEINNVIFNVQKFTQYIFLRLPAFAGEVFEEVPDTLWIIWSL